MTSGEKIGPVHRDDPVSFEPSEVLVTVCVTVCSGVEAGL